MGDSPVACLLGVLVSPVRFRHNESFEDAMNASFPPNLRGVALLYPDPSRCEASDKPLFAIEMEKRVSSLSELGLLGVYSWSGQGGVVPYVRAKVLRSLKIQEPAGASAAGDEKAAGLANDDIPIVYDRNKGANATFIKFRDEAARAKLDSFCVDDDEFVRVTIDRV